MLSFQFIAQGAREGETGVYVTFCEEKTTLAQNLTSAGRSLQEMEERNLVTVLDLLTVREGGLTTTFDLIFDKIQEVKAKRLVIDSYSVVSQTFDEKINARIMLHTILRKILREMGCTTVIISEGEDIHNSMEAYVSDAILLMRKKELNGRQIREMEIVKMRGTSVSQHKFIFTLDNGFHVIRPFSKVAQTVGPENERRNYLSPLDFFSEREVLVELGYDIQPIVPLLMFVPLAMNALKRDRKVLIVSSTGVDLADVARILSSTVGEELLRSNVKIAVPEDRVDRKEDWILPMRESILDLKPLLADWKDSGKQFVMFSDLDHMTLQNIGEAGLDNLLKSGQIKTPELSFKVTRPHWKLPSFACKGSFYRVRQVNGSVVLYGVKPYTALYGIEFDLEKYLDTRLIPIN